MGVDTINLLLIEDDEDDYIITADLLSEVERTKFELQWVANSGAGLAAIAKQAYDVILVDYHLGGSSGLDFLAAALSQDCQSPIILLTGLDNYEADMQAMQAGAADYLVKSQVTAPLLERTIRYALERKRSQINLQESELLFRMQAEKLEIALLELQNAQTRLIQSEKMSSLGQLVAGLAHEINNPTNFIHGNIGHIWRYVEDLSHLVHLYQNHYPHPIEEIDNFYSEIDFDFMIEDINKILKSMRNGTERIRSIVTNLRNFTHLDESGIKAVDLHAGLESTLAILHKRLAEREDAPEITIMREYADLPAVQCAADQLNQVFFHLINNAIDALDYSGNGYYAALPPELASDIVPLCPSPAPPTIYIRTQLENSDRVSVRITDNGCGIHPELHTRIFDPFFTTKPIGKGNGLGLAISYQVITEQHNGKLYFNSELGKGTEFIIELPISLIEKDNLSSSQLVGVLQSP